MYFSGGNEATLEAAGSPFLWGWEPLESLWVGSLVQPQQLSTQETSSPELILSSPSFRIISGIISRKSLKIERLKVCFSAFPTLLNQRFINLPWCFLKPLCVQSRGFEHKHHKPTTQIALQARVKDEFHAAVAIMCFPGFGTWGKFSVPNPVFKLSEE